jgi:GntR family transcriptional regulator/MocR family aminotransferase
MVENILTTLPGLTLDRADDLPLHAQLAQALRAGILAGRTPPGTRLPATRTLAAELGIGRNTVADAYDQLIAEGYLEARVGSGTRVAPIAPDMLLTTAAENQAEADAPPPPLSFRGRSLAGALRPVPPPPGRFGYAFQPGLPAFDAFPLASWTRISARCAKNVRSVGDYSEPDGLHDLREAIVAHVKLARGVVCEPDQVIVTAGTQAGLDLAARMLIDPQDPVWIEDPGYGGARGAFIGAGAKLVPVPVDEEGMDVRAARRMGARPRAIYVTPSHQFPLGMTMSLARRLELLELADEADAWIIEDDYDSEYRYHGRPLSSLQGLDGGRRVLYVGTFSKTFFPSLRLGYLVVPRGHSDAFRKAIRNTGHSAPGLPQLALKEFMEAGHYEAHTRRMRKLYDTRRQMLVDTLHDVAASTLEPQVREAGMQMPAFLKHCRDSEAMATDLARLGIAAAPLGRFTLDDRNWRPGLMLGFAAVEERFIGPAVEALNAHLEGDAA